MPWQGELQVYMHPVEKFRVMMSKQIIEEGIVDPGYNRGSGVLQEEGKSYPELIGSSLYLAKAN
jgi:hypothetical protein